MKTWKLSLAVSAAALALGLSQRASAHLPYVLPFQFNTDQDVVTLYAGSADKFFEPEIPGGGTEGGYDIKLAKPDGKQAQFVGITRHKQLTLIEIETKDEGTYKVNRTLVSREIPHVPYQGRAVQVIESAGLSEERKKSFEENKIKDGERKFFLEYEVKAAEITKARTINHVTAYVTRGKPSDAALKTSGQGFEVDFKIHPNQVSTKSGLRFVALLDGKPQPGAAFDIYRQGDGEPFASVKGDKTGLVEIAFERSGVYVLNGRAPVDELENGRVRAPRYRNWLIVEVAE